MPYNKTIVFSRIAENGDYEDFKDFAVYMRYTRGMSLFNSGLIYLQRPGAEFVYSERQWEKYGRAILPQAAPIIITVPFGPVEFLYDYSDTYGREVKFIPRESFSPPPPSALDAGVLPHAVQTINSMGIYYAVSGNYGSRLGGTAQLLPQPVEFAFGKKETVSSRYAIIVNDRLSDSEKVRAVFHEIGHILCSHLYYEAKDKRIVKLPERNRDSLSHYMKEYEAESVCREFCGFLGYQYDPSEYLEQYDEGKEVPGKENQVFIMNALNILIGYWDKAEK